MIYPYVHWHEGLFLGPHHLQVMSRSFGSALVRERNMLMPYPEGLIEASLAPDSLENRMVRFERLRAIMPSGVLIDTKAGTNLPALDINEAIENASGGLVIRLAVPLWKPDGANAVPPGEAMPERRRELYTTSDSDVPDENTGGNARQVTTRQYNARLIIDGQDTTGLETMPLLRVVLSTNEEQTRPKLDPEYAPPCLLLSAWPTMVTLVRELAEQVATCRKDQAAQLSRGGFNLDAMQGPQVAQMMRLRTLNVYTARLRMLSDSPTTTPMDVYLELAGLMAELAGLKPGTDPYDLPRYKHEQPLVWLLTLEQKVRKLLEVEGSETWWKLDLDRGAGDRSYHTRLEEKHLTVPNQYFLAVKTADDVDKVIRLVEDAKSFKCMPKSLEGRAVYGVPLKYEPHPPLGLPNQRDLHYFHMKRGENEMMWERVVQDSAVCCHWQGMEGTDFGLTIYMTVPQGN